MEELPREFYRLDELAREKRNWSVGDRLQVSRLFKGKVIGCIGCISIPGPYIEAEEKRLLESSSYQEHTLYDGYAHLSQVEVTAAFLRTDPNKKFTTNKIINDEGEILLLLENNTYSNNDLIVLSGEVDRIDQNKKLKELYHQVFTEDEPKNTSEYTEFNQILEDPEFDNAFERAARVKNIEIKIRKREPRTPEENKAHDEEEAIRENLRKEIRSIKDSHRKEKSEVPPRADDIDIIGKKAIIERCGYDPEKTVWTAIKRRAKDLGIIIGHVDAPNSDPVLKESETNRILAKKLASDRRKIKKVVVK